MKIRVTTDRFNYMGLQKGSVYKVDQRGIDVHTGYAIYSLTVFGKNWLLDQSECEEVDDDSSNEKESTDSVLDIQHGGSHYKDKKIQPIEYITANNLDFCQGNIVKYVTRHKDKNGAEDIRKVIHYAQFILKFEYGEDI